MTSETSPSDSSIEAIDDLIEDAEALIGTEALWRGQILRAGVELGMFTVLDTEPVAASDVATELGLDQDRTYRLLRAMASFDVVEEGPNRRFSLTPLGELFQRDHPHSVQCDILFNRSQEWIRSMLHLPEIVKEGPPSGFVREFGREFFDYLTDNPDYATVYNELMEFASREHPEQLFGALAEYDFSQFSLVCDVGGGRGHFLCHLLAEIPHLEGVILDLPRVVNEPDRRWASKLGVSDRCTYIGGDMFEHVPEADAYFLKWILHNWDDENCRQILSTVHESAPTDGRLFILETLVPGPGSTDYAKRLDITMMTQVGGRERTQAEYRKLLEQTDWVMEETWTSDEGPLSILEAVKG